MKTSALKVSVFAVLLFVASAAPAMRTGNGSCTTPDVYAAGSWADNATVTTGQGDVRGYEDNFTTWTWKAVPYARPPVGELRWQAPQDPEPWSEVKQSTEFCSPCPQTSFDNSSAPLTGSEDCLCLNIWRPRTAETGLPVFFWVHGGSNKVGSADPYLGAALAGIHNMIVVTINYRIGFLGWFTHPALRDGADARSSSGNYGTLDIIKALEWVSNNIEAFGGDPARVTVAGQSDGGTNALTLVISPLAAGLFHRVISQSGSLSLAAPEDGDEYAEALLAALLVADGTPESAVESTIAGMSSAEIQTYLRAKTPAELFAAASGLRGNPDLFTDGAVIDSLGEKALDDPSRYNQVPVIIGSTSEEGKLFMYLFGLYERWGPRFYQFFGKQSSGLARATGLDSLAYKLSAHESQPGVYCYSFMYGQYRRFGYNAWPTDEGPTKRMSWAVALGACHALDIPFTFGLMGSFPLFRGVDAFIFREDNRPGREDLSEAMMTYFARFAHAGDLSVSGLPEWTPWPRSRLSLQPRFMLFDANDTEALLKMARQVR